MDLFPRTMVGGVSLPRMIIGTNWFRGYSHTSAAKDKFINEYQSVERVADILTVFLEQGDRCGDGHGGCSRPKTPARWPRTAPAST